MYCAIHEYVKLKNLLASSWKHCAVHTSEQTSWSVVGDTVRQFNLLMQLQCASTRTHTHTPLWSSQKIIMKVVHVLIICMSLVSGIKFDLWISCLPDVTVKDQGDFPGVSSGTPPFSAKTRACSGISLISWYLYFLVGISFLNPKPGPPLKSSDTVSESKSFIYSCTSWFAQKLLYLWQLAPLVLLRILTNFLLPSPGPCGGPS